MSKAEQNYCVPRKELLAVVRAKNFQRYLYGPPFLIQKVKLHVGYNFKNMIFELYIEQVIATVMLIHYQDDHLQQTARFDKRLKANLRIYRN